MTSDDELDAFVRSSVPPSAVPPHRVAAEVAATLVRLPPRRDWRAWVQGWVILRYAVPVATAVMLGLVVGRDILPSGRPPPGIADYVSSPTLFARF